MPITPAVTQRTMSAYSDPKAPTTPNKKEDDKIPVKDNTNQDHIKEDHTLGDKATNSINSGNNLTIDPFLDDIQKNQQFQIDAIQKLIDKNQKQLSVYNNFDQLIKEFRTLSETLLFNNNDIVKKVTVATKTEDFMIEATGKAPSGQFDFKVEQLATNHQLKSQNLPEQKEEMGDPTHDTRTLRIKLANQEPFDIVLKTSQTSPFEISKAITAANKGVTSRVIKTGEDKSDMTIISTETGTKSIIESIEVIGDNQLNEKLKYSTPVTGATPSTTGMTQSAEAKNSKFTINGVTVTHQKNIIEADDVAEGIKISLFKVSTESNTVIVEQDNSQFVADASEWVVYYNNLKKLQNNATRIDVNPEKAGVLNYQNPISNLMESMSKIMDMQLGNGKITSLSDARFEKTYDKTNPKDPNGTNGTFMIKNGDGEAFTKVIQNNMTDFKKLFMGDGVNKGLAEKMKDLITSELNQRGYNGSALEQAKNTLTQDNNKLVTKIETIKETTSTKIEKLKLQFTRLQDAMTDFNDATNYFKLMTGSKD